MNEYKKNWYLANKERNKEKTKEYYESNKEKIKERVKKWKSENPGTDKKYYEKNKETILKKEKERKQNLTEEQREKIKLRKKDWELKNKDKIKASREKRKLKRNEYIINRQKTDPLFALTCNIRKMILKSFTNCGYTKKSKTFEILGCTYEEFKAHLESKFESWMTWENRGKYNGQPNYGWDIDHIIPLNSNKTEEGVIALNHYTNLQPLCSHYNRNIKKTNIDN